MDGFADIHAHPMAHLAFGGNLLWGKPSGPLDEAFPCCDGTHHNAFSRFLFRDVAKELIDGLMQLERESSWMWREWTFQPKDHPRDGYPTFHGWPFAGTMCHQQMHTSWLRRAFDNGLRVFCAVATNNRLLNPTNSDWMEIAHSASDVERIVAANKLAIIHAVEVDQIELLLSHDPAVLSALEEEATRYINGVSPSAPSIELLAQKIFDLGIRQVNPLHFSDNVFGGAALYFDRASSNIHWINLWRQGRNTANCSGWPAVTAGTDDLEYRLQELQLPANRGWSLFSPPFGDPVSIYSEPLPSHVNAQGLTNAGRVFLLELWRRGILIDIDHMSGRTKEATFKLAEKFNVPMISSHCWIRCITMNRMEIGMPSDWWKMWSGKPPQDQPSWPMLRHEGMRTDDDICRLGKLGGLIGTILRQPAVRKSPCLSAVQGDGVQLTGTTTAAAAAYLHVVGLLGMDSAVAIGSDVNGLAQMPGPSSCCTTPAFDPYGPGGLSRLQTGDRIWDVNSDGVAHYGLIPDLIYRWRAEGMSREQLAPLYRSAQGYFEAWSRAESAAKRLESDKDAHKHLAAS